MIHNQHFRQIPRWVLGLGDLFLINLGLFLAFVIRFGIELPEENYLPFLQIGPWITIAGLLIFSALRLYDSTPIQFLDILKSVVYGVALLIAITMALTFWARGFAFPRSVLVLGGLLQMAMLVLWRIGFWRYEKLLVGERRVVIVAGGHGDGYACSSVLEGDASEEISLILKFLNVPRGWFKVESIVAWCDENAMSKGLAGADAVMVAPSVPANEKSHVLAKALEYGCEVFLVPDFYDILLLNARVGQVDDLPVVEVSRLGITPVQKVVKRFMDLLVSSAGLLIASPLLVFLAFILKIASPGPILYSQERVGENGRIFTLYKFRSMVLDAESHTGPVLAAEDDPRVTPIGRFMRKTRLDELPQLFNILRGDMSLVGPRPERPKFVKEYIAAIPNYNYRHLVKPGLTGLAQIMGRYSTSPADKLRYDLYYIRNYSFFLDLKILLQTLHTLFRNDSAKGLHAPGIEEQAAAEEILKRNRGLST